jgi:hypothetical protein
MLTKIIDEALEDWIAKDLNCFPSDIPENMATGKSSNDWNYWKPINSTVTDDEIKNLEKILGVNFPEQYKVLLKYNHFIELYIGEVGFFSHPSIGWRASIENNVLKGYPREHLLDKGYLPFANYSDWGLWCFSLNERNEQNECPVYLWDHERPDDFEFVADNLEAALKKELERYKKKL